MDMTNITPISIEDIRNEHSKTLYRSICVPSTTQSYSLCIEFIKKWFISKFADDTFKSIYIEGKNIYDDFRSLSRNELLKRQRPSLVITPSIDWGFTNENIDSYPYGMELYTQTGKFKNSFFSCHSTGSYLGIGMETMLMNFNFRIKLDTRAQQLDMYKFIKLACRIGFTCGEDVDLDFHIPYSLMIQLAKDNGFEVVQRDENDNQTTEIIKNIPGFLKWLNTHSSLPFLYKHRTLNGKNEFFIRMRDMYVHIRPSDISADDGEREGQLSSNFSIEFSAEVRFPAPKMYAYYSNNAHKLQTVYGAWYQPYGPVSSCYTFKGSVIPDTNRYDWPLFMSTTYEDDEENINKPLHIEFAELLEGDVGECIKDCLQKGISPSIFCDMIFYNGGEYIQGKFDWEALSFDSDMIVRSAGTYIGLYIDNNYVSNFILDKTGKEDRIKSSKK